MCNSSFNSSRTGTGAFLGSQKLGDTHREAKQCKSFIINKDGIKLTFDTVWYMLPK